ncbi:MAG: glycosyltransferase family 4 protein [Actinomycetota bacterium]|nr:glycosyltransferase family 4 protein [Actinomycetota bacterium]
MRIAHVSDFYLPRLGGIEMQVSDLAARQRQAGHSVDVITSSPSHPDESATDSHETGSVHRTGTGYLDPAAWPTGTAQIRRGGYDVVHAHAALISPLAFAAVATATRIGVPTVVTAHSLVSWLTPAFDLLDRAAGWSSWPVAWSAVSNLAAAPLRELLGAGAEVSLLPNGIDRQQWRVERVDRSPRDVVIASVMRLAARKRPLPLLGMLRRARRQLDPDVRLRAVIVGDGPQRPLVERYLRHHRMDWVSLPGRLSRTQIRDLYGRADFFVAPARLESFGIAALEARCAGLPVVARADSGIADFVTSGRDGVLSSTDAEMTRAISLLAGCPATRGSMQVAAASADVSLGWETTLGKADEAYARAFRLAGRPWRPADQLRRPLTTQPSADSLLVGS